MGERGKGEVPQDVAEVVVDHLAAVVAVAVDGSAAVSEGFDSSTLPSLLSGTW